MKFKRCAHVLCMDWNMVLFLNFEFCIALADGILRILPSNWLKLIRSNNRCISINLAGFNIIRRFKIVNYRIELMSFIYFHIRRLDLFLCNFLMSVKFYKPIILPINLLMQWVNPKIIKQYFIQYFHWDPPRLP